MRNSKSNVVKLTTILGVSIGLLIPTLINSSSKVLADENNSSATTTFKVNNISSSAQRLFEEKTMIHQGIPGGYGGGGGSCFMDYNDPHVWPGHAWHPFWWKR